LAVLKSERLAIHSSEDVVLVRQRVRALAQEIGFGLVDQTKIVTAASEIARNTINYGGGGAAVLECINEDTRRGLRLVFEDEGPGIPDIALALKDGFTSGSGLGLGLGGAKRLSNEFDIWSKVGEGTRVSLTRWK
jgi:serine/threonine-protein kinase RsbT